MKRFLLFFLALLTTTAAWALDPGGQERFDRIMDMSLPDLAADSRTLLAEKYPDEEWGRWHFPDFVTSDQTTETSYRVAVKEPELLGAANISDEKAVVPCYCTCERFGHKNLLYCFWKDGKVGGEFDEHGSQCAVCMRQAFLAFLWDDLGATHEEIMAGMKRKFAPLIDMGKD